MKTVLSYISLLFVTVVLATAQAPPQEHRTPAQIAASLTEVADRVEATKSRLDLLTAEHVRLVRSTAEEASHLIETYAALHALAAEVAALPVTEPPIIVEPPGNPGTDPPVIVDPPPASGFEPPPDFSQAPFKALLPAFPQYKIPTLADCEWVIRNGVAESTRGLANIPFDARGEVCGWAYRASIAAGHELPITFGVYDDAGEAAVGGYYWHTTGRSICVSDGAGGWSPLHVEFVGLSDSAEVGLQWCGTTGGQEWGKTEYVGAFNIGLRGAQNMFGINANKPQGKVILDGCWFLNPKGHELTQRYNAAITVSHAHTLLVRRTKMRGKLPTDPYALYQQHNFYWKNAGPGGIWMLENHFQGSNGTCFQIRPGTDEPIPVKPNGPVVIAYNHSNGYGWEWGNDETTANGGAALTIWCVPDHPTFVYRNRIIDARYACLAVSQQGAVPPGYGTPSAPAGSDRNFYGSDGYPVGDVYIADNEFTNPRSMRPAVTISGCKSAHIWSTNRGGGQWHLNSQWAAQHGFRDIDIGTIRLYGMMPQENYWTWDGTTTRRMTAAELAPLRVADPVPVGG